MQHHYLLKIWYIGTNFHGSQRQPDKRTVEGELINTLIETEYINNPVNSNFKSVARTDRGVHALESAFSFKSIKDMYPILIHDKLPKDMGINSWTEIEPDSVPRFDCIYKKYRYFLNDGYLGDNPEILDKIRDACKKLTGKHNFSVFCREDKSKSKNPVINLNAIEIIENDRNLIFEFKAQSFLWEQIRRIMGFIIKVCENKYSIHDLENFLDEKYILENPQFRMEPAPPDGLILWEIKFPEKYIFHQDVKLTIRKKERLRSEIERNRQKEFALTSIFNN